jgi:phage terminase small subunit
MSKSFAYAAALVRAKDVNGADLTIVAICCEAFGALRTAYAESHELTTDLHFCPPLD